MAVNLSPYGGVGAQFLDNAGNVLTGGKIFTYAAGTTTPQATYTTSAGNIPHPNPIILDAAGRVPGGEIWLTDGLVYKFILRDANDVLIATYDGITGINSNFVAFTNQQEIQTATAGQTVFNLATMTYQPGTNSLSVFVDGVNQYGPGAQYAYLETDSDTVTFVNGLHVGAEVKFTTSQLNTSGSTNTAGQISFTGFKGQTGTVADLADNDGSDWIGFEPTGTGAVARSAQDKMRETVSVLDFGAVGDGVTDDTADIENATNLLSAVVTPGNFLVTEITQDVPFRLTGNASDSKIFNTANDKFVISSVDNGTIRNSDVTVASLLVSQNGTGFTSNNYPAIHVNGTDDSYVVSNTLETADVGISIKYGSASLGPYTGNPATENQPKRSPRANVIGFNTIKELRRMGIESFGSYKTRIIGNAIDTQTLTASSHSYRFTGFPGIPCTYNVAQSNIGGKSLTGVSIQNAVHANDLSGFVVHDVTQGVQQTNNTTDLSYFSKLNRVGAIVDKATTGASLAGPQHSEYNLIINETTGQSLLATPATYGDNRACFFNVIARDANIGSGHAIQIQTDNNIGKFIIDDSAIAGLRIDGNYNIIDVVVNNINGAAISVNGDYNIVRVISSNNSGTDDVVISGDKNTVTVNGANRVNISGADKSIVIGHCGSLLNAGTNSNTTLLIIG